MKLRLTLVMLGITFQLLAQNLQNSPWHLVAENPDPNNYFGVTCANGVIGIVSSPNPMQVKDVVLNGVYDYYQRGRVSNILKTFNHLNVDLKIDGQSVGENTVRDYQQVLDMQKASLLTTFKVANKVEVRHQMMALRHLPYTALTIVEIKANEDVLISPSSVIEAPDHLSDVRNFYADIVRPHVTVPLLTSVANSPSGKIKLACSNSFLFPEEHGEEPRIQHIDWDYNRHWATFDKQLKAGETYRFAIVGSTLSSEQYEDPQNEAERLTIYASLEGLDRLIARHEAAWAKLWQGDIIIEGDLQVQKDVRSALYHLYSFARANTSYSISPMGLSGLGYNGHIFWDTEIWMFPPLLLLHPEIAKSTLEYRFERLEAAKTNAFAHGYDGAMFPWESAGDGSEDTPVWALTGPFQHHITADVGWAFWKYYQVTKDQEWLETRAYPMLKEVADFWCSRVDRDGPGRYNIKNVVGSDEYAENIDNDAYTNGMAITVLRYAVEAAKLLGETPNPDWSLVADNIPIEKFEDGTTQEYMGYEGQIIKQADVNLLAFPLKIINDPKTITQDLAYYEKVMDPKGPAMGFCVLATLYARLGNEDKAYGNFLKSYAPNKVPPFGVLSETAGGTNPYFATGAGGMLQAIMHGFGGLEISTVGIKQNKSLLPKQWKKLTIKGVGMKKQTFEINR